MTDIVDPHMTSLTREAAETPEAARSQISRTRDIFKELGKRLRHTPPSFVATCARGSSDHITTYGKYVIESFSYKAVASLTPGLSSVYTVPVNLKDALFISVSQSGKSPDILAMAEAAKKSGALVVGFVNNEQSPLFELCDIAIPLSAGPEKSVAATKSCLVSGLAYLQLAAHWCQDQALLRLIDQLPELFEKAAELNWEDALLQLESAINLYVIGRGPSLGIAQEIALKLKETCGLHAEAFSSAEVIHGPLVLAKKGFPVLLLGQNDQSLPSLADTGSRFLNAGSSVLSTIDLDKTICLPTLASRDTSPVIEPLCQLLSFYMAVSSLALKRGFDPDRPPHLRKVTETV